MAPPKKEAKKKSKGLFDSIFGPSKPVSGDMVKKSASSSRPAAPSKAAPAKPASAAAKAAAPAPAAKVPAPAPTPAAAAAAAAAAAGAPPAPVAAPAAAPAAKAAPKPEPASVPDPLRKEDAVAAWQPRPRVPSRLMTTHVNFMVLGESGLGKTTFINNLTSSFKVANGKVGDGSATTLSQFQADPEALRTVLEPMDIPESSRRLMISIQDMPGWGDDINLMRYLRIITSFVLEKRAKDYDALGGSLNLDEAAMCGQLQNSITACLYFMPPHRVKKIDLILMAAISQLVTIIPVIGKSDCMTEAELSVYRSEVLHMLNNPGKFVGARNLPMLDVSLFNFAESILAGLGTNKTQLPLAVVCSRDQETLTDASFISSLGLEGVENPNQPIRNYRWGVCYPLNRRHSDLIVLKRLLLGDQVESLYAMLDDSYSRYVSFCTSFEESGKQLQMVVQDACQVGGPHLEYDDYAKAKVALDSAKAAMSTLSEENRLLTERLAAVEKEKKQLMERVRVPM